MALSMSFMITLTIFILNSQCFLVSLYYKAIPLCGYLNYNVMAKTITILKQVPKKVVTKTGTELKEVRTNGKVSVKRVPKVNAEGETIEIKQRFTAIHSEKGITITFGNMKFGVMRGDTKTALENFMRGTDAKDTAKVQAIIAVVKTYMKSGLSDKQICTILNTTQQPGTYAQTLQVYLNQLNKPVPAPINKTIEVSEPVAHFPGNTANEFGDDDHGLDIEEHGHLFVGAQHNFPVQMEPAK